MRLWLRRRLGRGKEDPARWRERLGEPGQRRPPGALAWLHAVSVGEAVSALTLAAALRAARPDVALLLTTGTVTSAALVAQRAPQGLLHQFVPVDLPGAVGRFLDHWRPDLALWFESELWPLLLTRTRRRCPLILVNGRMSPRSFTAWQRARWLARYLLGGFAERFAQSGPDAERLAAVAGGPVHAAGNLKRAAPPVACDADLLAALQPTMADRPVWLAASTHPGEEAIAVQIHAALAPRYPDLLTLIVPRHPERGAALAAEFGLPRRSAGAPVPPAGLYLADTLGELGLWYRLAPVVFVGGSLTPRGGQNPLEAARLGAAVIAGPDMTNQADAAEALDAAGALVRVADADGLLRAVEELLSDPVRRRRLAAAARAAAAADDGVVDALLAAVARYLPDPH